MFGALLIHLAVIAAPATAAHAITPDCASVHCSATVDERLKTEDCAGVHCAPLADKARASDTRYGAGSTDASHDSAGLDAHTSTAQGVDRNFDTRHDTNYDREGYDRSGTWPAH